MVNAAVVAVGAIVEFWGIKNCDMKETIPGGMTPTMVETTRTMAGGMAPRMPENAHKEIPGNPSTATSSKIKLSDRSNGEPLRVLSEADWAFWIENGYVIIRNAVPAEQVQQTADFLWEFEEKDPN